MNAAQKVFTTSRKRILEMLIIGQMSLTVVKSYIPKILMTEKKIEGKTVTFLQRAVECLQKSGVYKKNGVNTKENVKNAITDSMEEFFDYQYSRQALIAG